jgi:hypothetical protein
MVHGVRLCHAEGGGGGGDAAARHDARVSRGDEQRVFSKMIR